MDDQNSFLERPYRLSLEIAAVSALVWMSPFVYGTYDFATNGAKSGSGSSNFGIPALLFATLRDVGIAGALLFIIYATGVPLAQFGLARGRRWSGILVLPGLLLDRLTHWIGHRLTWHPNRVPDFGP